STGATISQTYDPTIAVTDADALYTEGWTSTGQENENELRKNVFEGDQVNENLVKHANKDYLFMHRLPAKREVGVTYAVLDGANSVVFDQAEHRLHSQKAMLASIVQ